ncbi:hypothetical protein JHK82_027872 [Glycine max]|nr:hypothetical protein JHK82_027872 [Glycine max]
MEILENRRWMYQRLDDNKRWTNEFREGVFEFVQFVTSQDMFQMQGEQTRVKQKKSTFTSQKLDKLYTSYSDISWNKTERMPLLLIYQGHRSSVSSSSTDVQTCSGYLKLNFPLILGDHDDVDMAKFDEPAPSWLNVSVDLRDRWFGEFKYRWHPQEERAIRAVFETKGSCILKSAMNKIRNGQDKGKWITANNVRASLDEHWGSTDFLNKSSTAKVNRSIDRGASAYCGGSIFTATHFEKLVMEKTKKLKLGEWVNDKSRELARPLKYRKCCTYPDMKRRFLDRA